MNFLLTLFICRRAHKPIDLLQSLLKTVILGQKEFILSRTEYKRVLLTGQLSIITFCVCLFYLVFGLAREVYHIWPYQLACALLTLLSWWLNRKRRYNAAKTLFIATVNITIFIFASVEPVQTGIFLFYVATGIGAFAIFGYENKTIAFLMVGVSVLLFFVSVFFKHSFLPHIVPTGEWTQVNLIINFIICVLASSLIIYFLVKVNYRSENELRENEKKILRQNQELTKINGELDRFVYSTSHDLRAPLSSIQGLINLSEMAETLPEVKQYIDMMKDRVANLDKFINDISDYARNSRLEVTKIRMQLKKAIRDVLENLRFYPHSDKIRVELDVPDDLYIHCDSTRLQMILANLISNSFKYHDRSKEDCYLKIQANFRTSAIVEIELSDNGIGIQADLLPKIFEMFFQAHEQSKGSGLGLYIVKETLEKLGGSIMAQSEPGKGSSFTILLPQNKG